MFYSSSPECSTLDLLQISVLTEQIFSDTNINLAHLHGHLCSWHFLVEQLNLSINQQSLIKSSKKGRKSKLEHTVESIVESTRLKEKDSQVGSSSFYCPPNMFKTGRFQVPH